MRKPLIAGNWKMHGTERSIRDLMQEIQHGLSDCQHVSVLVIPTFVHLQQVHALIHASGIKLGAQNMYLGVQGAYTGEVSGPMLKECHCDYVLVGHSERRSLFHEELSLVAAKFKAGLDAGLIPILCVGETREEREQQNTEKVIRAQLESVIQFAGIEAFKGAVIAYEPVWAIGTGLTATPEQAQTVHAFIRQLLAQSNAEIANRMTLLYGGSVKADNAASLFAMPDIDGGLVGGASLDAVSFLSICHAAEAEYQRAVAV